MGVCMSGGLRGWERERGRDTWELLLLLVYLYTNNKYKDNGYAYVEDT